MAIIGRDFQGRNLDLSEILSKNVIGGTEKFSRKSQSEWPVAWPRFEARISRMQSAHYHFVFPVVHFSCMLCCTCDVLHIDVTHANGLVVKFPGYRSRGPSSIPGATQIF
jgi:hypothetical protein